MNEQQWPQGFNPSDKAAKRVPKPWLSAPKLCRYCFGQVSLFNNSEVYGKSYGKWPWVYLCKGCDAYVGLHPDTWIPLGTLANKELRQARKDAKLVFNQLWIYSDNKVKARSKAYKALADHLKIHLNHCHFGLFEIDSCLKAIEFCRPRLNHQIPEKKSVQSQDFFL